MLVSTGGRRSEDCDVVIVGARCAGSAAAAAYARAGRRVVVLDRAAFPADTLSTHLLFPAGVDELRRMGALDGTLALDPSLLPRIQIDLPGVRWYENFQPVGGIAYGMCVPRILQDAVLVEAARAAGAEVRERCDVQGLLWEADRATGVRYRDEAGEDREISAKLVVGADGRRSIVAAEVGSWHPYRLSRNGRGSVFRYMDDPRAGTRDAETMRQWRDGDSIAMAFPSAPRGRLLLLFMGHRDEASAARRDPEGYWAEKLALHPGAAERTAGSANLTKVRSTGDTPAFFRASSGPGWALAGDSGHFKDPVIGQGMRDALWMGRTLAEATAPVLDRGSDLDRATRAWEEDRDRECLPAYHFANLETRVRPVPAVFRATIAALPVDAGPTLSDVFARTRTPAQVLNVPLLMRAAFGAVRADGPGVLRDATVDLMTEMRTRAEARSPRFRSTRPVRGSDHPGAIWPDPPRVSPSLRGLAVSEVEV